MKMELPELPYAMDALEPYMSAETLEYHYGKHHNAYVSNGNVLIEHAGFGTMKLEEMIKRSYSDMRLKPLFNNVSQHWNHEQFWQWMKPGGGGDNLPDRLKRKMDNDLGSFEEFKKEFIHKGFTQFGSGWVWLSWDHGRLKVESTPNGESPLVHGKRPILGCDVWEHSYYIDHRNDRKAYLNAFLENLVNWEYVDECLTNVI